MTRNGLATYQQMDVLSMSPARRVVFLYTHLVANLRQARQAFEDQDIARRSERLAKAREIVEELLLALDREAGGPIADQLASLYAFFIREILQVDIKRDRAALDPLIRMATSLLEAWRGAAEQVEAGEPQTVNV